MTGAAIYCIIFGCGIGVLIGLALAEFKSDSARKEGFERGKEMAERRLNWERNNHIDVSLHYEDEIARLKGDIDYWRTKAQNREMLEGE